MSPVEMFGAFLFAIREKNAGRGEDDDYDAQSRAPGVLWILLFAALTGVAVWLVSTAIWEQGNWHNLKMDEVAYELSTSLTGTGNHMIRTYLLRCVVPALAAAVLSGVVVGRIPGEAVRRRTVRIGIPVCAVVCGAVLIFAFVKLDVGTYLADRSRDSAYIQNNYVSPEDVTVTFPEKKRNLIYIYLESMESTFSDTAHGGAFSENYIPELTRIAEDNISFTGTEGGVNGGFSPAGTTWTAGAMFAQNSGLPLKIPISGNEMDTQVTFFPSVQTMGDILHAEGYRQILLIGSDATFGGRRLLFSEHGGYEIWDHPYAQEQGWIPDNYAVWWGYEDQKLFQFARDHLTELAENSQPFNLTMLTVDTHFPDGYVCNLCQEEFGENQYANVLACSSRQVDRFIRWVKEQPFYENTTIVLMGDHPTMDADFSASVDASYERKTYVSILHPADTVTAPDFHRDYTTFDLFPTTLAALGADIQGDRLGLGVNLFSGQQTLLERDGLEEMNQQLRRHSDFIDSLSGFSDRVLAMAERLTRLDTDVTVAEDGGDLLFTIRNLERVEEDFTSLDVDAYGLNSEGRTGLWSLPAERQGDGVYLLRVSKNLFQKYREYSLELFVLVDHARLQVDGTYQGDLHSLSLEREPEETSG